jgi:uncharacterized membrane protein YphA (DoxX/SURF4 family)
MAVSNTRLRNALALVRVVTGVLFLFAGAHKIASWEFAKIEFPRFLWEATHGGAVGFYSDFLSSVVSQHVSGTAALVAFVELFIGIGLVLGLAVRPVSLVGILYSINLMLATWNVPGADQPMWQYLDNATRVILLLSVFLLLGFGHAGESWGLGALYHKRRRRDLEESIQREDSALPKVGAYSRSYLDERDEVQREWELHGPGDSSRLKT